MADGGILKFFIIKRGVCMFSYVFANNQVET